jgi:signal transduction histidine kinase
MPGAVRPRGRLFRKYVVLFALLVSGALLTSGLVELHFSYRENLAALVALQREQAAGAAARIEAFVRDIERQVGWASQGQVGTRQTVEQRRFEFIRLQRQAPAVTEVSQLDAQGREQLRVSRLAMDVVGSGTDFSADPRFKEARPGRPYFGPVYFRKESEPYLSLSVAGGADAGVTVAEVNLKFIWDVVSQIRIGSTGRAYVVDGQGQLVAHPDISLVLQKTDLSRLEQVRAVLAGSVPPGAPVQEITVAKDSGGRQVLTASAPIAPLGWWVFVEQPIGEALAPLYASAYRTIGLLLAGIALSVMASLILARRMTTPIHALEAGAARIGTGALDQRIDVKTGDELEGLADQFNRMAAQLQESYATLERKVEDRTRELSEALEQQTATAEILRVISSSPTDIQPVLDAVAESAARVCGASDAVIFRIDQDNLRPAATYGSISPGALMPLSRGSVTGRAVLDRRTVHVRDLAAESEQEYSVGRDRQRLLGHRTTLATPLLREGVSFGAILIRRMEVRPFSDKQVKLLETFAAQAVIAIENVRLFQELETRNSELSESLEQQTATAEILRVISSSPTDIQPVLDAVAANAARVCAASDAIILRIEGDRLRTVAGVGSVPRLAPSDSMPLNRGSVSGRAVIDRRTVHVADIAAETEEEFPVARARQRLIGVRSALSTPLLREGTPLGAITIRRTEVRPFSDKQIALLETFAAQAVIAIENVRLFQELETRNSELSESLEQQTATAEILRVISSSPTDIQPVLNAVAERAARLCGATLASIFRLTDGGLLRLAASHGSVPTFPVARPSELRLSRDSVTGRAVLDQRTIHIEDVAALPESEFPETHAVQRAFDQHTTLATPLLREGRALGAILIRRTEVKPFTEKQIALLETFAAQAAIGIENVRLVQELQVRTQDLARSVEQLQALGAVGQAVSSTLDLPTVLTTIVSRAVQLAGAAGGVIYEYDEPTQEFRLQATHRLEEELVAVLRSAPIQRGQGATGQAALRREPVQLPDINDEQAYRAPRIRAVLLGLGYRSVLAVPLLSEQRILGVLTVWRQAVGQYPAEVVDLLKTLAAQSAIAIQNARLFSELGEKGRELEAASRHKSEFLANMSHELRTPLNAIIGFSEVLGERMFGELNDKQAEYIQDILSSGRHLLALINDILDLSKIEAGRMELELSRFDLSAAISGAVILVRERATRHGLTLDVSVDDRIGPFAGDERKIRQVLLNLLSNAVKFTPEGGRVVVRAAPANGSVEISVTDTGIGIAPEDQEAIFQEFRQVGTDYARKREGTGLGLALARRFVDLHGGRIWVKSRLGEGSTFTFTLPVRPWPAS